MTRPADSQNLFANVTIQPQYINERLRNAYWRAGPGGMEVLCLERRPVFSGRRSASFVFFLPCEARERELAEGLARADEVNDVRKVRELAKGERKRGDGRQA